MVVKPSHGRDELNVCRPSHSSLYPRITYKDHILVSITEEDSPALLFKRQAAIAQCLGVITCFQRRRGEEMADLSREIQKDLLSMNSKVHLIKRKLKQGTKLEKGGVFCALFCIVLLKMSNSTKPTTQPLLITIY